LLERGAVMIAPTTKWLLLSMGLGTSFVYSWASPSPASAPPAKVALRDVKYPDLARAVVALRGKVVVVEIWGFF
jgi:hypothetical protein